MDQEEFIKNMVSVWGMSQEESEIAINLPYYIIISKYKLWLYFNPFIRKKD